MALMAAFFLLAGCGPGGGEVQTGDTEPAEEPATDEMVVEEVILEEDEEDAEEETDVEEENLPAEAAAPEGKTATADIEGRSGEYMKGTAVFEERDGKINVTIEISGVTEGEHGLHIHENGDCSAPDASSAGGHFNPVISDHGAPSDATHHAGDLGNITIGKDGSGTLELSVEGITLGEGPTSIIGRAVVLHAKRDDLETQPSGASGPRIGCGVIR